MTSPCAPGTECERTEGGIIHDVYCYDSIMQTEIFGPVDTDLCSKVCFLTGQWDSGCPHTPPYPEPISDECCASGKCEVCAPGGFGGSRYW